MHPRLQTAFDVMYSKAEPFLSASIARRCTAQIRDGRELHEVVGELAAALTNYTPIPSTTENYRRAITAFAGFWAVLVELQSEVKEGN